MTIITALTPPDMSVRADQYSDRTDGLHLSRITHDLLCSIDPNRFGEREGGPNWMNFWMGLVFERALEMAWLDKEIADGHRPGLIRPGEVSEQGVIGTPDAYDTIAGRPEEYKCTKMSCRQDISHPKFWHYWVQLKAYAYMLGCDSGALWILFVNGNYSRDDADPESGYIIKGWEAKWTMLELAENWSMLTGHARRRGWLK